MSQLWTVNSRGGFLYSDELSSDLRSAVRPRTKYRQFCDAKDASVKAKKHGDLFHWDVYGALSVTGDTTLSETNTISEGSVAITQGTLTCSERGKAIPYTGLLEDLAKHDVSQMVRGVLTNWMAETLDYAAYNEFNKTPLRIQPTGGTNTAAVTLTTASTVTGTIAASCTFNITFAKLVSDTMKERNIPPYVESDYMAIAWPSTLRGLKTSLEGVQQYSEAGFRLIYNAEIGRYENFRFVEQTNIAKPGYTNQSSGIGDIFFFGGDTVMEGMIVPEQIRAKIPTDFGRSKGIACYYLGGFGIVHNSTDTAQARIVKWASAA